MTYVRLCLLHCWDSSPWNHSRTKYLLTNVLVLMQKHLIPNQTICWLKFLLHSYIQTVVTVLLFTSESNFCFYLCLIFYSKSLGAAHSMSVTEVFAGFYSSLFTQIIATVGAIVVDTEVVKVHSNSKKFKEQRIQSNYHWLLLLTF